MMTSINYGKDCDYCVICGAPIPEGGQICAQCKQVFLDNY